VIALMYHDVVAAGAEDSSGFPGRDAALYKVTPELFEAHLSAITGRARPDEDSHAHPALPAHPARPAPLLTFDDGGISGMTAADVMERHGLTGFFFVTVNYLGAPGFLTPRHLRELRQRGHIIGSHSCSHPLRMGHCPLSRVLEEWTRSRAAIADALGEEPVDASVPGGDFAPHVATAAGAAGFTRLFTSEPVRTPHHAYGVMLHGRFIIQRRTSPRTAAALAAGSRAACTRQAVAWAAKKIGKQLGGTRYLDLRRLLLRHSNEVRWGDQR
jgi:peptidoglycan/xylan/chitin deacetylase (PgdA/CDA1 family)